MDISTFEHKSPSYRKINPLGKVPALIDDDIYVWDSHAICIYLVEKFAPDDSLYPKELVARTRVNQILFFEATILFQRLADIVYPLYNGTVKEVTQKMSNAVVEAYEMLENILDDKKFICGHHLTIADLSVWSTLLSLRFLVPIDGHKLPRLENWLKIMKTRPTYELNQSGANQHYGFIKSCIEGKPHVPKPLTIQN